MTGDPESESSTPGIPADEADGEGVTSADEGETPLGILAEREGWQVDGSGARVHYRGETDRYSIEYYAPSNCTLYWKVPPEESGATAVPVGRDTVPEPLRKRVREDLAAAGIDPEIDGRKL